MNTVPFTLDLTSKVKLHFQLYQNIVEAISTQKYGVGQKLPSVRHMAEALSISRNTVTAAYKRLTLEGYVSSHAKSGYIVNSPADFSNEHVESQLSVPKEEDSQIPTVDAVFKQRKGTEIQKIPVPDDFESVNKTVPKEPVKIEYSSKQLRKQLAIFLYNQRHVTCTFSQLVISESIENLLINVYKLFFQPIVTEGKGLLKLAQAAAEGKLDSRSGVLAISESAPEEFLEAAHSLGIKTIYVHTDKEGISVSELDMYNVTGVVVFPYSWSDTISQTTNYDRDSISLRKKELLEWAAKKDCRFIIEYDFERSSEAVPALQYFDRNNKVVYLGSLPSGILLENDSVSYIVLPPQLLSKYRALYGEEACFISKEQQIEAQDTLSNGKIYDTISQLLS